MLRAAPRGDRFQEMHRQRAGTVSRRKRMASIGAGLALVITALVTYPIPGPPSTLMLLLGLTLVAQEWAPLARSLDRLELWIHGGRRRVGAAWTAVSKTARVTIAVALTAFALAAAYGLYALLRAIYAGGEALP